MEIDFVILRFAVVSGVTRRFQNGKSQAQKIMQGACGRSAGSVERRNIPAGDRRALPLLDFWGEVWYPCYKELMFVMHIIEKLLEQMDEISATLVQYQNEAQDFEAELKLMKKSKSMANKKLKQAITEDETAEQKSTLVSITDRIETLNGFLKDLDAKIYNTQVAMCEKCDLMFNSLEAAVYHMEIKNALKRRTGKDWNVQWVHSWDGPKVGLAFLREDDPSFEKQLHADVSLGSLAVDIENTDSRKIVFTDMQSDPQAVYLTWNWLEFYVYHKYGFFFDEIMASHYEAFIERDEDFAEFVADLVRKEASPPELSEVIEQI